MIEIEFKNTNAKILEQQIAFLSILNLNFAMLQPQLTSLLLDY